MRYKIISLPGKIAKAIQAEASNHQKLEIIRTRTFEFSQQLAQSGLSKTLKEKARPVLSQLLGDDRVQQEIDNISTMAVLMQAAFQAVEARLTASEIKLAELRKIDSKIQSLKSEIRALKIRQAEITASIGNFTKLEDKTLGKILSAFIPIIQALGSMSNLFDAPHANNFDKIVGYLTMDLQMKVTSILTTQIAEHKTKIDLLESIFDLDEEATRLEAEKEGIGLSLREATQKKDEAVEALGENAAHRDRTSHVRWAVDQECDAFATIKKCTLRLKTIRQRLAEIQASQHQILDLLKD